MLRQLIDECRHIKEDPAERAIAGFCAAGGVIGLAYDLDYS